MFVWQPLLKSIEKKKLYLPRMELAPFLSMNIAFIEVLNIPSPLPGGGDVLSATEAMSCIPIPI